MKLYFAPMEGVTDSVYRRAHASCFGVPDQYFTPFLSPARRKGLAAREMREILPEENAGLPVVPQLLTNHAENFLWAAGILDGMGYREVNLNLGCPSGTVTAKKKGAGQLADVAALDRFLDTVFKASPLAVSIKTRIGVADPAEFPAILAVFCKYPLAELIIHARLRNDFYQGTPRLDAFQAALAQCPFPVCYNGDLLTPGDVQRVSAQFPGVPALMLGRGAAVNPGLFRELRGQARVSKDEIQAFHALLYQGYRSRFSGERAVLCRMKEHWSYLIQIFADHARLAKALRKAGSLQEYEAAVAAVFQTLSICQGDDYRVAFKT